MGGHKVEQTFIFYEDKRWYSSNVYQGPGYNMKCIKRQEEGI